MDDRYLYFTAHGRGNRVIVQDRFTGELVWSTGIASIGCCSNPVMSDGMVILGSEDLLIGIRTGATGYALDSPWHGTNACGYNVGAIVWSSSGNTPPIVNLMSPANGSTHPAPATMDLVAMASDTDGSIIRVEFWTGMTLINADTSSPYSYTWIDVSAGSYALRAIAYDNQSATSTSTLVNITVYSSGTPANQPPTVTLTSPATGGSYTAPAGITLAATATDPDGSIAAVRFYHGTTLLGTDSASPYSFTWTGVPAGNYALTAQAVDDGGAVGISSAVTVTVNPEAQPPRPVLQPGEVRVIGSAEGYINATINPNVTIRFRRTNAGTVTMRVYDLWGRLAMETNKDGPAGIDDDIAWNAAELSAGVYIVRVKGSGSNACNRIAILR